VKIRVRGLVVALAVLSPGVALAQNSELPLKNWTAPPYWTPPRAAAEGVWTAPGGCAGAGRP
jgi:hypothetical protein